jgi:pimeloyl-ACP methyl ester carboxylesterase
LAGVLRSLSHGLMDPLWERLPSLPIPVLLIVGEGDPAYRTRMQDMAARLPQAQLVVIPASGHAIHREQPEALRRAVGAFLAN